MGRAKRSLIHFGIGKAGSAMAGFACLVIVVRVLAPEDYGVYVALIAILEIFFLLTGFGLSSIAQRYVAEYRVKAAPARFQSFIGSLLAGRFALASFFSLLAYLGGGWLLPTLNLERAEKSLAIFALLLVFGTLVRFLDELFASLLMQGSTQGLQFGRNLLKLGAMSASLAGGGLDLSAMLLIETATHVLSVLAGCFLLRHHVLAFRNGTGGGDEHYANPKLWSVSLRFFAVQVFGQVYGDNALKLVVTRVLGASQTAVFGFAQSITDMLRNYLPAHMLIGWIRPLLVARYVERGDMDELAMLTNLILKLNLFIVTPVIAYFAFQGDILGDLVSGGKYPAVGLMLTCLTVLIAFQTMHLLLSLVTITLERANANIAATVFSCLGLPLAFVLTPRFGVVGVAWSLIASEFIWVVTVWMLLRLAGIRLNPEWLGNAKVATASAVAFLVVRDFGMPTHSWLACVLNLLLVGVVFLVLGALMKPFTSEERAVLGKLLPLRWFVW